jgi:DNA ligase D-like protein (predicted 3'-phosphoesterase)
MKQESLESYRKKRDFSITSEPQGKMDHPNELISDKQIFVVQKHAARNLHYDLRLEVGGILRSWAVPKGPSLNPKDKRLAIATEDHPLEYARFEGTIPKGQYGAGTVIVWDMGTYRNMTMKDGQVIDINQALNNGHTSIWLEGKKLKGGYAITRTGRGWILVKMRDENADETKDILKTDPRSALSGRTIEELAEN